MRFNLSGHDTSAQMIMKVAVRNGSNSELVGHFLVFPRSRCHEIQHHKPQANGPSYALETGGTRNGLENVRGAQVDKRFLEVQGLVQALP